MKNITKKCNVCLEKVNNCICKLRYCTECGAKHICDSRRIIKHKVLYEQIKQEDIGEILQKIYDSEIHIAIGWFWDGGVDFCEWDKTPYMWTDLQDELMRKTDERDMTKAFEIICKHLILIYPESSFAIWFKEKYQV